MQKGNIEQIGGSTPSYTRTVDYDVTDRVERHTGPDGTIDYDYDKNGNRLWHKENGVTTNYTYATNKRLTGLTGGSSESRSYDSNGNTTQIGSQYFDYNDENRLWRYRYGGQTVEYSYNSFGERQHKTDGSAATRYVYEGPSLIHERYGSTQKDYVYLDGQVVGYVHTVNNSPTLYYVHTDHIGRPQVVTNLSKQKVWESENNAFGNAPILDMIGGFNIGFPGQYFDSESGTFYNYFRNYDPSTGRYLQNDPIGVFGGLNTYAYASGNPLSTRRQIRPA